LAVAVDKSPLFPGSKASFDNISNHTGGINGLMVDLAGLPEGATPTLADFVFRVGRSGDPASWAAAPAPRQMTFRPGAGLGGAGRVVFVWDDGAIRNTWLQVTVLATDRTGLPAPYVFYFGSLVGETGDAASPGRVTGTDLLGLRRSMAGVAGFPWTRYDFDHDGRLTAFDVLAIRSNLNRTLPLIAAPPAAPAASPFAQSVTPRPSHPWDESDVSGAQLPA
jgi:hypothetical protein